ncbi:MAG: hypothetical protein A2790_13180 [Phenylobacterium sp. RIFCSPHIGHO2_01_FULL_69_31]|uniref:O-linked N-acetylglucosamine transferase, SPINDLY family protein n=1 Tax=Phenylobacterium sp. RIFCSPHIGHO2_01_FULL_69_31 TaxID=1801944 RepID=UPI0008CE8D70|nr:MAG: hypothetical protein A2790_13180 [Phenylobacterium sp. RIFCSPHIGHO2_01_FULL_69_31]
MQDSIASAPASALAARKAAAALRGVGQHAEALAILQQGAAAFPNDADVRAELGLTFALLGRPQLAEQCYRRALQLQPDDVFALSNLGGALLQMRRPREAEVCFRRVLELQPEQPQALRNLTTIARDSGRINEAKAYAMRVFARAPALDTALQAHLALSPIAPSQEDIQDQRQSYAAGLQAFAASTASISYSGEKLSLPWFHLAYHNEDDRGLVTETAAVLTSKGVFGSGAAAPADWRSPADEGRRIRVVFCSEFFSEHTIGRLYRGLVARLDRNLFEVIVLHSSHSRAGAFRAGFDEGADIARVLPPAPEAQRDVVRSLRPDVLFFPDVGMAAQTYFLAGARLAPVQATSWGHPDTTGLSTIDYFLSAHSAEPPEAQDQYQERLVLLPRLPSYYQAPGPIPVVERAALGLPEGGTLYGCPQSLFKFHPDFDAVLGSICRQDPTARIVLIQARNPSWTAALRARWARSEPILLERVHFLPPLSHEGFMAHLAHIDVLLDPLHFGSGNTLYEGMAAGVPIVTWPGRFMRGRIVAAAYAQMEIADPPIARDADDYARIAVELGRDADRRSSLRSELLAKAKQQLFADDLAVRAFEAFLTAAVQAAATGNRLERGWRPMHPETFA